MWRQVLGAVSVRNLWCHVGGVDIGGITYLIHIAAESARIARLLCHGGEAGTNSETEVGVESELGATADGK